MTATRLRLDQDLLRAMTDRQLREHKSIIDQLMANLPKIHGTQLTNPLAINYIADYFHRTAGFDRALAFMNTLEEKELGRHFFSTRIEFLLQHERIAELEEYIQELARRKINLPMVLLLCLKYYLSIGQRHRAESYLTRLITERPRSEKIFEAMALATVYELDYDRTVFEKNILWGDKFSAMSKKILETVDTEAAPVVYCLNLDRSPKRMSQCSDLYQDKVELRRIPGLPGNAIPEYLLSNITINPDLPGSAVGCALSHIAAWEKIAKSDSTPPLMIIEDDGLPLMLNRATYGFVQNIMKQQNFDLLFVHEAASPLELSITEFSSGWKPEILHFDTGIERFMKHQKNLLPGWGMYGYFLSTQGAQKLLTLMRRDGLCNHIDWQAFLYSVSDWEHPIMNSKKVLSEQYQRTTGRLPKRELNTGILNFPMIAHIDFSHSTR